MHEKDFPHLDPARRQAGDVRLGAPVVNDAPFFELQQELGRVEPPKELSISRVRHRLIDDPTLDPVLMVALNKMQFAIFVFIPDSV